MPAKKRIGEMLIEAGLITPQQLEIALAEQKKTGELVGAILFSLGFVSQKDLFKILSMSHEQVAGTAEKEEIPEIPEELEYLVKQSSTVFRKESALGKKELDSAQSPLVRLVEKIISAGIIKGATDIHVGPDLNSARVRYRVDGVLQHGMFIPVELLNPVVSRFKILGQMNIAETRLPQDGGAEFYLKDRKLDLRISTFPVTGGENVVVRILDKTQLKVGLENLGFFASDSGLIHNTLLKLPYGMIIVTGPTGSGKTTTLYSCLSVINTVNRNIFTLEDPIEYQLPLARQSQVNVKAGLTFATGLRHILRQDPDIILVGEMRDLETAELAVRAALTGHLVFSTLHTNDAISSIIRLIDMGIEPFLISSILDTIIAQRLVRLLCVNCKTEMPPGDITYEKLGIEPKSNLLYLPKGCGDCGGTGYKGRTVIYEILKISVKIRNLINRKAGLDEIREQALSDGFKGMYEAGMEKVKMGLTTLAEISSAARTDI